MAVTIRDNTKNGDMWNEWATLLNAAIFDADAQQNDYDDILKALANIATSKRWGEKATTFGGLGDFEYKAEGTDATEDTFVEGYAKFMEHITFAKSVLLSKEMIDDNQIAEAKAKVINLVQSYKRTRAKFMTQALTTSIGTTKTMAFGNKTGIDIGTPDNKALFAADHPLKNATGVTQANLFSNALGTDPTVINALSNLMRNFKDDRGEVLGFEADTIIIPGNRPSMERFAKAIIGSEGEVGGNKNDINTERGNWKMVVNPLWTPETGNPYILMSSKANKALLASRFYNRTDLDVENEVKIESRNMVYNGFGRFVGGFTNWRHVIMGGSDDASAETWSA